MYCVKIHFVVYVLYVVICSYVELVTVKLCIFQKVMTSGTMVNHVV